METRAPEPSQFTHVWARPGQPTIIDFADADGMSRIFGRTAEEMRAKYPTALLMEFNTWRDDMHARENPPFEWIPVHPRAYSGALSALPPAATRGTAFLLGESVDMHCKGGHERFWAYRMNGTEHEQSSRPITKKEFEEAIPAAADGAAPGSAAQ